MIVIVTEPAIGGSVGDAIMQRKTQQDFLSEAKRVHGDLFDYSKVKYVSNKTKIVLECRACRKEFRTAPTTHLKGAKCPFCSREAIASGRRISHDDFLVRARAVHGERYTYVTPCKGYKRLVKIRCNDCGSTFEQMAYSHLRGNGCRMCAEEHSRQSQLLAVSEFEARAQRVHLARYAYSQDYCGYKSKVTVICPEHGAFRQDVNAHLRGQGCSRCDLSWGELAISEFLKRHNITHECEKKFPDCRDVRVLAFDFYLPDLNMCIEYDGEHHFFPVSYFGGERGFVGIKQRDAIKTSYCEKNGIKLLRIAFSDYRRIDEILTEQILVTTR